VHKKVILIGCGNIGSRHLQALVKLPYEIDIQIVDPNENSQKLAKSRLNETEFKRSNFNLTWHSSIENITESNVVILATPSINRVELVEQLLKIGNRKFLIEKMVCQSANEFNHLLSMTNSHKAKVWVNASRRYYNSYQKIFTSIKANSPINLSIHAGNMGLGSNAIHFLDLFSWITKNESFRLNGDFLDTKIQENKRGIEYKEFSGTIMGKSSNNSIISINFSQENDLPVYVNFFDNKNTLIIDETKERILELPSNISREFKVEFQSNLTTKIVKDIFEKDNSLLPTLEESKIAHFELFRIFNNHIKKITNDEVEKCPIT